MLIWIDDTILNADLGVENEVCQGISDAFSAAYRGEHYVLGSRRMLRGLAKSNHLSRNTKQVITSIENDLANLGSIDAIVDTRLIVTYGLAPATRLQRPGVWEVPIEVLGRNSVRKVLLLTENLEDCRAFVHAASQHIVREKIGSQLAIETAMGGGSTTPGCFENSVNTDHRWCICITDSDRLCFDADMCLTARQCAEIATQPGIVAEHMDLSCREVENALPLKFIEESLDRALLPNWEWHVSRLLGVSPESHSFCDLEKGLTLKKFQSFAIGSPHQTHWSGVLAALDAAAVVTFDCDKDSPCASAGDPCKCYLTRGFGGSLLTLVLETLDQRTPHKSNEISRNDPNLAEWKIIGKKVFEWGCAPERRRH